MRDEWTYTYTFSFPTYTYPSTSVELEPKVFDGWTDRWNQFAYWFLEHRCNFTVTNQV